ncbi:uncharacterized protein BDR25DRAFT_358085 [Lindgomyces ingoldianus]|uniref:Uncharacterized protein n=1 Tax=Lindgomyces ingoldianus TaxID=673940 RepID=A0ACB6QMK4_9PLEO|nr:uncharacterized protein BDR25DRAFT_358085 [Lindgomyces ingoldianus]KAF2467813.1 hypothetical protein BDR25DRAFT_358085 [Lindgomyces ingoldianus]
MRLWPIRKLEDSTSPLPHHQRYEGRASNTSKRSSQRFLNCFSLGYLLGIGLAGLTIWLVLHIADNREERQQTNIYPLLQGAHTLHAATSGREIPFPNLAGYSSREEEIDGSVTGNEAIRLPAPKVLDHRYDVPHHPHIRPRDTLNEPTSATSMEIIPTPALSHAPPVSPLVRSPTGTTEVHYSDAYKTTLEKCLAEENWDTCKQGWVKRFFPDGSATTSVSHTPPLSATSTVDSRQSIVVRAWIDHLDRQYDALSPAGRGWVDYCLRFKYKGKLHKCLRKWKKVDILKRDDEGTIDKNQTVAGVSSMAAADDVPRKSSRLSSSPTSTSSLEVYTKDNDEDGDELDYFVGWLLSCLAWRTDRECNRLYLELQDISPEHPSYSSLRPDIFDWYDKCESQTSDECDRLWDEQGHCTEDDESSTSPSLSPSRRDKLLPYWMERDNRLYAALNPAGKRFVDDCTWNIKAEVPEYRFALGRCLHKWKKWKKHNGLGKNNNRADDEGDLDLEGVSDEYWMDRQRELAEDEKAVTKHINAAEQKFPGIMLEDVKVDGDADKAGIRRAVDWNPADPVGEPIFHHAPDLEAVSSDNSIFSRLAKRTQAKYKQLKYKYTHHSINSLTDKTTQYECCVYQGQVLPCRLLCANNTPLVMPTHRRTRRRRNYNSNTAITTNTTTINPRTTKIVRVGNVGWPHLATNVSLSEANN